MTTWMISSRTVDGTEYFALHGGWTNDSRDAARMDEDNAALIADALRAKQPQHQHPDEGRFQISVMAALPLRGYTYAEFVEGEAEAAELERLYGPTADEPENLETCPWRVMYSETVRLQAGGERTNNRKEHCGCATEAEARVSVAALRNMASQGVGLHYGQVINAAWVEYVRRTVVEG